MRGQYIRSNSVDFESLVNRNGPVPAHCPEIGPCWEWTGTPHSQGYGLFGGRFAHRVAFERAYGHPARPFCLHRCDNRKCVRPSHLFEGTARDNHEDMRAKHRDSPPPHFYGDAHPSHQHPERVPRGSRSGAAKVTEADIVAIVAACNAGERQADIGRRYGLTQSGVSRIYRGDNWGHISDRPAAKPSHKGRVTSAILAQIHERLAAGESQRAIARSLGINQSTVSVRLHEENNRHP